MSLNGRGVAGDVNSNRVSPLSSSSNSELDAFNSNVKAVNSTSSVDLHKDDDDESGSLDNPTKTSSKHVFSSCLRGKYSRTRIGVNIIDQALRALRDNKGSTVKDISDYLANQGHVPKSQHCSQIAIALRRGGKHGFFVRSSSGSRYKAKSKSRSRSRLKRPRTTSRSVSYKNNSKSRYRSKGSRGRRSRSYPDEATLQRLKAKKMWLKKTINSLDFRKMMQAVTSPSPIEMVRVGGIGIPALIDTGAVLSMMSPDAYAAVEDVCPLITQREAPILRMINPRAANNSPIPIRGLLVADVTVGNQKIKNAYIVVMKYQRPPPTFIVGMNIIKHLSKVKMDKSNNKTRSIRSVMSDSAQIN